MVGGERTDSSGKSEDNIKNKSIFLALAGEAQWIGHGPIH